MPWRQYDHKQKLDFDVWVVKYKENRKRYLKQMKEGKGVEVPNFYTSIAIIETKVETKFSDHTKMNLGYTFHERNKMFKPILKQENQNRIQKVADDHTEKKMKEEYLNQYKKKYKQMVMSCTIAL